MKQQNRKLFCIFLFSLVFAAMESPAQLRITDLRTEYLKNPLGIGVMQPRFFWKLHSETANQVQTAWQVLVASSPARLTEGGADFWNSGRVDTDQSIHVVYNGKSLQSRDGCWWKVRVWDKDGKRSAWSEPAYFEMGLLSPSDWQADWIKTSIQFKEYSYPSPLLRKEFKLAKKVKSARLYCTSLGLYEFYINGKKAGNDLFTPGYTNYLKRLQYQVYDVTSLLKQGANAVGVMLGNGWYRTFHNLVQDIQDLEVLAQIEIEFSDGSIYVIQTDNSWRSSTGAILKSEIYDGEIYDARLEKTGWNNPGFDDRDWAGVTLTHTGKDIIDASITPPVKRIEEIKPVKVIYTPEGDTVLDMGQLMVGWCRLSVDCPAGTVIKLRHAEVMDKEGNFHTANLGIMAKLEVTYTCKGGGTEVYEPRFTYQGFRYVAISGYPKEVTKDIINGIVIHTDLIRTGTFSCNNPLINQLQSNIVWTQKATSLDIPNAVAARAERVGWTACAMIRAPTGCFNMDYAAFYTRWLKDLIVDQNENGSVPWIIPSYPHPARGFPHTASGAAGYDDVATVLPWNIYLFYGDKRILEVQYESMKGWVEYIRKQSGDTYLWKPTQHDRFCTYGQFGDWIALTATFYKHHPDDYAATTDKDLITSACFYHSTDLLQRAAKILGNTKDASEYRLLMEKIKEAFNKEYVTLNGRLSSNTQTAYVLALSFGLFTEEMEKAAAGRLAADVRSFGHLTTGILGTPHILHILTRYGYLDEAYMLLYRTKYPSWLYMVTKGATTIWERWDGIKPDGTFPNHRMNSFNHCEWGAVGTWLYRVVAGINPDTETPGFKNIIIKPHPGNEMNDVSSTYESMYGTIRSEWQIKGNVFTLRVSIPVNSTAEVFIPSTGSTLTMNGKSIESKEAPGVEGINYHFLQTRVGSGDYVFETEFGLRVN